MSVNGEIGNYTEDSIKSLDWKEHIRLRPGMYIGKLGDGSAQDDGIYVLVKEVIDNSIDEHMMGFGKTITVKVTDHRVEVRDFGRGIPLGKVVDCVSKINTGGKYDSSAFQKSVGLNGVGTKAVNALSNYFKVQSIREGQTKVAEFSQGEITNDAKVSKHDDRNGTLIVFEPDNTVFKNFHFIPEYLEDQMWNYAFLNTGLTLNFNGEQIKSDEGLKDLLTRNLSNDPLYPLIHLKGDERWIELGMGTLERHVESWLENPYGFRNIVIKYEDLLVNTGREVRRICTFLDIDVSDERIQGAITNSSFSEIKKVEERTIECKEPGMFYQPNYEAAHNSGIRFMNQGKTGEGKKRLSADQIERARKAFLPLMERFGYL